MGGTRLRRGGLGCAKEREELKAKAAEAEEAYEKALADARAEASRIAAEAKAEMQAEVDAAIEKADADLLEMDTESEEYYDLIDAIGAEEVRAAADKYLSTEQVAIAIAGPPLAGVRRPEQEG